MLTKVLNYFSGKKSYITALLLVVLSGLLAQGYIDEKTYQVAITVLGALGLYSLRSAVTRLERK